MSRGVATNRRRGPRGAQWADGEPAGEQTAAATTMASKGESRCPKLKLEAREGSEMPGRFAAVGRLQEEGRFLNSRAWLARCSGCQSGGIETSRCSRLREPGR